jgi:hypothetical protein
MQGTSKQVKAPPVEPQIEPTVTVGHYLDGMAFYEDVVEVIALHVLRSAIGVKDKYEKPLWWLLPRRRDASA